MEYYKTLLRKVEPHHFFQNHWEKDFLLLAGEPNCFDHLFNWNKLNYLLNNHDLAPHLRMSLNGKIITPELISKNLSRNNTWEIPTRKIFDLCDNGATLILQDIYKMDDKLKEFTFGLSAEFGEKIGINAYLTGKETQGFSVHSDAHEVFVLQIEGSKNWELFGFTEAFPTVNQTNKNEAPEKPIFTCKLNKGDVLYIPRGMWHQAYTDTMESLHLSISISCRTKISFLRWTVDQFVHSDILLRQNLPLGFNRFSSNGYDNEKMGLILKELNTKFSEFISNEGLIEKYNSEMAMNETPNLMKFNFPLNLKKEQIHVDFEGQFRFIGKKHLISPLSDSPNSVIYLSGGAVLISNELIPIIEYIFTCEKPFTIHELIEKYPEKELDKDHLMEIIKELIIENVLE